MLSFHQLRDWNNISWCFRGNHDISLLPRPSKIMKVFDQANCFFSAIPLESTKKRWLTLANEFLPDPPTLRTSLSTRVSIESTRLGVNAKKTFLLIWLSDKTCKCLLLTIVAMRWVKNFIGLLFMCWLHETTPKCETTLKNMAGVKEFFCHWLRWKYKDSSSTQIVGLVPYGARVLGRRLVLLVTLTANTSSLGEYQWQRKKSYIASTPGWTWSTSGPSTGPWARPSLMVRSWRRVFTSACQVRPVLCFLVSIGQWHF